MFSEVFVQTVSLNIVQFKTPVDLQKGWITRYPSFISLLRFFNCTFDFFFFFFSNCFSFPIFHIVGHCGLYRVITENGSQPEATERPAEFWGAWTSLRLILITPVDFGATSAQKPLQSCTPDLVPLLKILCRILQEKTYVLFTLLIWFSKNCREKMSFWCWNFSVSSVPANIFFLHKLALKHNCRITRKIESYWNGSSERKA